ncbi:hypothetical protein ACFQH6_11025 [Halobacteriaceae archaeon GCM10025711]
MTDVCTYCGAAIRDHDPVAVYEGVDDRELAGQFCNYACLSTYIEEEGLVYGTCCTID